jgi:hypothetical protein
LNNDTQPESIYFIIFKKNWPQKLSFCDKKFVQHTEMKFFLLETFLSKVRTKFSTVEDLNFLDNELKFLSLEKFNFLSELKEKCSQVEEGYSAGMVSSAFLFDWVNQRLSAYNPFSFSLAREWTLFWIIWLRCAKTASLGYLSFSLARGWALFQIVW